MRFSQPLFMPKTFKWLQTQAWKNKKHMWDPPLHVPSVWRDKEIIDAAKLYLKPVVKTPSWSPPVPDDPRFMPEARIEDHPDYKEMPVYDYKPDTYLLEGVKQALNLTKTQLMDGVPGIIEDNMELHDASEEDELVKKYIMQANVWNPTKVKLPRRFNPQLPRWQMKAEFGIPYEKRALILLENLLRLASMNYSKFPEVASSRFLNKDHQFSSFFHYNGEKHVQIGGKFDYLLTSKNPLTAFANESDIEKSAEHTLPNLYPVSPLIDLKKTHFWDSVYETSIPERAACKHPHTAFFIDPPNWPNWIDPNPQPVERNITRAIMLSFAFTIAHARNTYGVDCLSLPSPICMQYIHTDGVLFNFIYYQLNTLDFSDQSEVKNMVWVDSANSLYMREEPKRAMLRNTLYSKYDSSVLEKLYASYTNGLDLKQDEVPRRIAV